MAYEYFPITLAALNAEVRLHDLTEGVFDLGSIRVTTQYLNHPALTLGYRLEVEPQRPLDRDLAKTEMGGRKNLAEFALVELGEDRGVGGRVAWLDEDGTVLGELTLSSDDDDAEDGGAGGAGASAARAGGVRSTDLVWTGGGRCALSQSTTRL